MKKIATLGSTVAMFAAALLPAMAAGNNCANGTTGPFSTNYCNIENKSDVNVENVNDAHITNKVTATSNTGNNTASYNTLGGAVQTGNAGLNATISNVANVNTTNVNAGAAAGTNLAANEVTGPYSDNRVDISNSQRVDVVNRNDAYVKNDVDVTSNTGDNAADYNTYPGSVRTGNAGVHAVIGTHVNDNATAVTAGAGGTGVNHVTNSTTGPFSTDYAEVTNRAKVNVDNINDAFIGNFVEATSNTGANSGSYNTLGGEVGTGNAGSHIGVNSEGNINTTTVAMALGGFGNVAGSEITGPFSDNRNDLLNEQNIDVENLNRADVFNFDYDVADTGYNAADYNTAGGGVGTGLSELWKSIATRLNDSLTVIQ